MTRHRLSIVVAALAIPVLVAACSSGGGSGLPTIPPPTPVQSADASAEPTHPGPTFPPGCPREQPEALTADDVRDVTIQTDLGNIDIRVEGGLSPIATGNFVALAECGWYDGVVFHRVVTQPVPFVIQGGDGQFGRIPNVIPELVGTGGPPYTIQDEPVTTEYRRGTVAMARSAAPNSVGSQFFIVLDDAASRALADPQYNNYQIIGEVTSGMETVDKIAEAAGGEENPSDPVVMNDVSVTTP